MDFSASMQRVVRAASFDVKFYNEAKDNTALTNEALTVVVASTALAAIGSLTGGLRGLLAALIAGIVGYYLWAWITKMVGANFFQGSGDMGQLLRTLGYASAPRALGLLGIVPCVGSIALLISFVWTLATGILAVREAHVVDTTKAIIITLIGWVVVVLLNFLLLVIFGAFGAIF
jgi:hypothetical protein